MGLLVTALVVVVWIVWGLLIDRVTNDGRDDVFERGTTVVFGPPILLVISPFIVLGYLAQKSGKAGKRG
jgi:hypothetical protein